MSEGLETGTKMPMGTSRVFDPHLGVTEVCALELAALWKPQDHHQGTV